MWQKSIKNLSEMSTFPLLLINSYLIFIDDELKLISAFFIDHYAWKRFISIKNQII